jgi:hypothetical protein
MSGTTVPAQAGVKWHSWQPPRTAEDQPQETTTGDMESGPSRDQASTHGQMLQASFFRQASRRPDEIGITDIQGLPGYQTLPYEHFGPDGDATMGSIGGRAEEHHAIDSIQASNLEIFNNASMEQTFIEPFIEPDWINNFDFSAATYLSVFQTALPLWPTIDWSPNSLIQAPESPKQGPENLHKTLPTPSSGRRTDFDPNRSEGALPLLDRVFSLVSSPVARDESGTVASRRSSYLTSETRNLLLRKLDKYEHITPRGFVLPSYHALNRYVAMYFTAGARHQPFIHEPTWYSDTCSLGLLMAVCAMGARYCFEIKLSRQLWALSRAIIRCNMDEGDRGIGDPNDLEPSSTELLENCQGLLLLTMYATWAGEKHFLRQALAFQSGLATVSLHAHP